MSSDDQPQLLGPGHRIGSYVIEAVLGAGGGGAVYLATDSLGGSVAVKVLHEHLSRSVSARARLAREVRLASAMHSPATVSVIDADTTAARPWLAMEYVEGPTLREEMPLGREKARSVALALLDALGELHRAEVVHRDLKPSNVMLAERGAVLIDFGVAAEDDSTRLTLTGQVLGTTAFMAPEQVLGQPVDPATDVWAWGALMAAATTQGEMPYGQGNTHSTMRRILDEAPDLSGVPDWIRPVCESCLQKEAEDRPSLAALRDAVAERYEVVVDNRVSAPVVEVSLLDPPTGPAGSGRRKSVALSAVAVLVFLAAAGLWLTDRSDDSSSFASDSGTMGDEEVLEATQERSGNTDDLDDTSTTEDTTLPSATVDADLGCAEDVTDASQRVSRLIPVDLQGTSLIDSTVPVSCQMTTVYRGHTGTLLALDRLSDGRVVSSGWDAIRVWDPDDPVPGVTYTGHGINRITSSVVLSDDRIASADDSGAVHIWSPSDVLQATVLLPNENGDRDNPAVGSLASLDDGDRLAVGLEGRLVLYDGSDWSEVVSRNDQEGLITRITQLTDGEIISASSSNTIARWSSAGRFVVLESTPLAVEAIAALPDSHLAIGYDGIPSITIFDSENLGDPSSATTLPGHLRGTHSLRLLASGQLASGGGDRLVKVWDLESLEDPAVPAIEYVGHLATVRGIVELADSQIASGGGDTTVRIFDPAGQSGVGVENPHQAAVDAVLVDDVGRVISSDIEGVIRVWGENRSAPVDVVASQVGGIQAMLEYSDGSLLVGGQFGLLRRWPSIDVADEFSTSAASNEGPEGFAAIFGLLELADGRILSTGDQGRMLLWDISGQELDQVVPVVVPNHHGTERVQEALQLPSGDVVTVGRAGSALRWTPNQLDAPPEEFASHDDFVRAIALIGDGRVATAGRDTDIQILSQDGELQFILEGHRSTITDLLTLPDGRLVSTSFDGTLRVWEIGEGGELSHTSSELGLPGNMALLDDDTVAAALGNGWVEVQILP